MFSLATPVGPTIGQCITQLAKMSIEPKFVKLTAYVFRRFLKDTSLGKLEGWWVWENNKGACFIDRHSLRLKNHLG